MTLPEAGRVEERKKLAAALDAAEDAYNRRNGIDADEPYLPPELAQDILDVCMAALTTQAETIRRLEGVIADKYPAPPNHYLVALQNHLKGAEQRAEAAEGRVRDLLAKHDDSVCCTQCYDEGHAEGSNEGQLAMRERAAKVGEKHKRDLGPDFPHYQDGDVIAAAIRALELEEPKEKQRAEAAEGRVREAIEQTSLLAADYFSEQIDMLSILEQGDMAVEIQRRMHAGQLTRIQREIIEQYGPPATGEGA